MPKLPCPKCKQTIEIQAIPAGNRIRCGSCGAEFSVKPPAKAAAATVASSSNATAGEQLRQPSDPNDPFASIDLNNLGRARRVDLGVAPMPTGPIESPTGNMAPWLPGNAPVYVPISPDQAEAMASGSKQFDNAVTVVAPKKSNAKVMILVGTVLLMMAGGSIVAAVMVAGKSSGGGAPVAAAERPTFKIPEGFELITIKGVDGIIPKSEAKKSKIPGGFDGRIAESPRTSSIFVFAVTDQLGGEITQEKVSKAVRGMLHGDILTGQEITVAGHKGWQGSYATGVYLPERTTIEMIPIEDRFIIRGYIMRSSMQNGFDPDAKFDTEAEQAELKMFKESIYIGKKPGMFGF